MGGPAGAARPSGARRSPRARPGTGRRRRCRPALGPRPRAALEGTPLGRGPSIAERVGFIEEDDHAPVPEREPTQLPVERLDLQDAHAHEHVDEGAGVDRHERFRGLSGDGLRHQGLARAGRPPQQDPARDVAATLLDRLGIVQEDHVLLHAVEHGVLPLHVAEARLDLVRHDRVHATPGQEPEQPDELQHDEDEPEGQLEDEGQRRDEAGRSLHDAEPDRIGVEDPPQEAAEDEQEDGELEGPAYAIAGPVLHLPHPLVRATPHVLLPEGVVALGALLQEVVQLADPFEHHQRQDPPVVADRDPDRVAERPAEGLDRGRPHDREPGDPQDTEEQEEADAIPEDPGSAGLAFRRSRTRRPVKL